MGVVLKLVTSFHGKLIRRFAAARNSGQKQIA
jgi:hypothetical protein